MAVPFSNTKLRVPAGFRNILEGFAREVLRDQPNDIYVYGAIYFDRLLQIRAESGYDPVEIGAQEEDYLYNTDSFKRAALEARSRDDNEAAALKIQTKYRQYCAKKTVQEMRETRAAVKIQSVFRGHRGRKICRDVRQMSLSEADQARYVAEAEDAEEYEREGDSPHGIYLTDIPDRKSDIHQAVTEVDVQQEDATDVLQPAAAEAEATEETKTGSEESQEEKKEVEEEEEDDVISDLEDAATRIQAGLRGIYVRMTLKSGKLAGSSQSDDESEEKEVEEEEAEEEKDDTGLDSTVEREPSGISPAAVSENTEEAKQETSEEKKEDPVEEEK